MTSPGKIVSILIKAAIGIAAFYIIWLRLKDDLTAENLSAIRNAAISAKGMFILLLCLVFIPLNWGIESYKWKLITAPVEQIGFGTAQRSVYSGICFGNLAPGRATEFLAKIIFFKPENRVQISILHFVNGMFQLSVTYLIGFTVLAWKFNTLEGEHEWIAKISLACAAVVMIIFVLSIIYIDKVLHFAARKVKGADAQHFNYRFSSSLLFKLFSFSIVRYGVFFAQMAMLMYLFSGELNFSLGAGIALYFLITTSIPMISFLEGAIRAAIAIFVFSGCGISDTALALASVGIWIVNIIVPSVIGYFFLIRENFEFSLKKKK